MKRPLLCSAISRRQRSNTETQLDQSHMTTCKLDRVWSAEYCSGSVEYSQCLQNFNFIISFKILPPLYGLIIETSRYH